MYLNFGGLEINTHGLPRPLVVRADQPVVEGRPTIVSIALEGRKPASVARWAKRLGVEVVEKVQPLYPGDPMPLEVAAVVETGGFHITVYVRTALPAAEPAWGA